MTTENQAKITHFPVGNGDMTMIQTESGKKILIDLNIRVSADDPNEPEPDVGKMLRDRLTRDEEGRLFVDVLLLSHPDKDHCSGLQKHFHLGAPDSWSKEDDKIFIREIWSSPMVFRNYTKKDEKLCEEAKLFNSEAKRRVRVFKQSSANFVDGNRIQILGEDENGKTDTLDEILVKVDKPITKINGQKDKTLESYLLAPFPIDSDEEEDSSKNRYSTIIQFRIAGGGKSDVCRFLTGGDAGVVVWEKLFERHQMNTDMLSYDILLAPHHCSWHSLSHDSWSKEGENAEVSKEARNALENARPGAHIVASSDPIKDDDNDPPCIRAKREYLSILGDKENFFICICEWIKKPNRDVLEFTIDANGLKISLVLLGGGASSAASKPSSDVRPHG